MFFLVRAIFVIGLLFYLSPARTPSLKPSDGVAAERAASPVPEKLDDLSRSWSTLPEPIRRRALEAMSEEFLGGRKAAQAHDDTAARR